MWRYHHSADHDTWKARQGNNNNQNVNRNTNTTENSNENTTTAPSGQLATTPDLFSFRNWSVGEE